MPHPGPEAQSPQSSPRVVVDTPVFQLLRQDRPPRAIFILEGDVRLEHISYLREAFWEAMNEPGISDVVIDLSQTTSLDYTGISLFVSTKNALGKQNGHLILCAVPQAVLDVFERTSLNHYFDIRHGTEDVFRAPATRHARRKRHV